jgi:capsid protein
VPYELLTGDLSQVNYSSIRAGLVEFRRMIDAVQWQLFIPMCCAPLWRWFTEAAWAAGLIPTPEVAVEWSPPKFEAVDPQKEATAQLLAIRSGTMTLAEVIARQGRNPDAVLAEIAATNAKLDALGLVLDSDPRKVTKTGILQGANAAAEKEAEEGAEDKDGAEDDGGKEDTVGGGNDEGDDNDEDGADDDAD